MLSCSYSRLLLSVGFSFSHLFISTSSSCDLICINVVTINSIVVIVDNDIFSLSKMYTD